LQTPYHYWYGVCKTSFSSETMENLANTYWELLLQEEKDRGKLLAMFYWACMDKQGNTSELVVFRKATKLYGWKVVFKAILDIVASDTLNTDKIGGILFYLCKKNFLESTKNFSYQFAEDWREKINEYRGNSSGNTVKLS